MRRYNPRVALTLSELLIVVSIIVVLLIIVLPVLNHAKVSSYEAKSKSNLRQLSISLSLYRSDQGSSSAGGTTFEMGLPPAPQPDHFPVLNMLLPPLNSHKDAKIIGRGYYVLFSDPGYLNADGWKRY